MGTQYTLLYIHDPMCSWCWGFSETWRTVRSGLPSHIGLDYLMGGLARDNEQPMPDEMQRKLQATWRRIQEAIPGTQFNFDFWKKASPRRSTYPACRAVIAARTMAVDAQHEMIDGIQRAYYLEARNPSDISTLVEVAEEIGLEKNAFRKTLLSGETDKQLQMEIARYESLPVRGFPSLLIETGDSLNAIHIDYNSPKNILAQIYAATE